MRRYLLAALAAVIPFGRWFSYRLIRGLPLDTNHFADRNALRLLSGRPEFMTILGDSWGQTL